MFAAAYCNELVYLVWRRWFLCHLLARNHHKIDRACIDLLQNWQRNRCILYLSRIDSYIRLLAYPWHLFLLRFQKDHHKSGPRNILLFQSDVFYISCLLKRYTDAKLSLQNGIRSCQEFWNIVYCNILTMTCKYWVARISYEYFSRI